MAPLISIVIPLYNKQSSIGRTIESILRQTYSNYEIIIIDDGSTDGSLEIVKKYADSHIGIINQENAGVSVARNRGVKESKGEFISFLDADDEWKEDYLELQVKMIQDYPDCDVFATAYESKDGLNQITPTIYRGLRFKGQMGFLDNYFEVASISNPPIWTSAVVVRKNAIMSIGGFPEGVTSGEDLLTWARLACKYKIVFSKKICAIYNLGEGYDYANLPPRRQDKGDPVGKGLKELYRVNPGVKGLRTYIAHWHKMRASVAIRYGEKWETINESMKSLFYNPLSFKIYPFLVLSILPKSIRSRIIMKYKE